MIDLLFSNPSRPFFRSTQLIQLDKIASGLYSDFIIRQFRKNDRKISAETVNEILEWTDTHTYYVQLLCNRVYTNTAGDIPEKSWRAEASKILKEQEYVFFGYREMLTQPQWHLLKAIALEGKAYTITSKDFISEYNLGSPATVLRSLHSLVQKELLYKDYDNSGNSFHAVYDVLFRRWIETV